MNPSSGVQEQLQALLLAYERLDASWRQNLGLSANEKIAVLFLAEGVSSPAELAGVIGVTSAGITNLLDRLEARGFVAREQHPTDRRRTLVSLTKAALRVRLEFEQSIAAMAAVAEADDQLTIETFLHQAATIATQRAMRQQDSTISSPMNDIDAKDEA